VRCYQSSLQVIDKSEIFVSSHIPVRKLSL